ncbi:hypothetical protein [Paenibacillus xylanivorans]|uniref:Lipoprotein n=1 Tax=Paenibacillus xylanivorans TaxID=1705561 RepID=A0A0N0UGL0_9BACL|nr:hypothetical protein [Paenibacillus xylanivorans]KOY12591.1 hypothetical protein AMS66_29715 [Paenibacillus xylanivorans]
MNKKLLLLFGLVLVIVSGCSGTSKFDELKTQAEAHYAVGDYVSALAVYNKALDEKEDAEVRTESTRIKGEVERIKEVMRMYNGIKDAGTSAKNIYTPAEAVKYAQTLNKILTEMEAFDVSSNDNPGFYIGQLVKSSDFTNAKIKTGLLEVNQSLGISGKNAYEATQELIAEMDALLTKYELRKGFAAVQ